MHAAHQQPPPPPCPAILPVCIPSGRLAASSAASLAECSPTRSATTAPTARVARRAMLSPWVGAGAALDGRRLFDLEDARKIVMSREEKANERFAHALARAPRLADVIPQVEGVDSAWRVVKSTLAAPSWNPKLRVPLTTLDAKPPAQQDTLRFEDGDRRSPLMPSLFMPGFPKAATTFLYNCLLANFGPTHVGCGRDPEGWTAAACARRFALTTLHSTSHGDLIPWKEPFFYGGKPVERLEGERDDLLGLHGPDPRHGRQATGPARTPTLALTLTHPHPHPNPNPDPDSDPDPDPTSDLTRATAASRRCLRSGRGAWDATLLGRRCRACARCASNSPPCRSRAPPPPTAARTF